jgi:ubiquinone/menaquinone biosynthesis C-methylase UbiE
MKKTKVEKHFDIVAENYDYYKIKNAYYYKNLKKLLGDLIPKNKNVFEVGCGTGDLLASLNPKFGYGMDISDQMIAISKVKYQKSNNLKFSTIWPSNHFDYIFMSDVIEHLENPVETFRKISKLMGKNTVFIDTMANPLWEPILMIGEKIGFKMPEGPHKRIGYKDTKILSDKSGMKVIKHDYKLLMPIYIPLISDFINKSLEKPFKRLAFIEYLVAVRS